MQISAIQTVVLALSLWLFGVVTANGSTPAQPTRVEFLYNSSMSIELPVAWRVRGGFVGEDVQYFVDVDGHRVMSIIFTNSLNFKHLEGAETRSVQFHGATFTEYRKDGQLTDIAVRQPCGLTYYVLIQFVTKEEKLRDQTYDAIRTLKCVISPWPSPSAIPNRAASS